MVLDIRTIFAWKELLRDEFEAALLGCGLSELFSGGGVDLLVPFGAVVVDCAAVADSAAAVFVVAVVSASVGSTLFSCLNLSKSFD